MKKFLTIFLAGVSTLAIAQKRVNLSRSIDDDGKKMSIRVQGTVDGKEVDFDKTFDVEDLDKEERAAFREEILNSIGAGNMDFQKTQRSPKVAAPPKGTPEVAAPPSEPVVAYVPNDMNPNAAWSADINEQSVAKGISLPFTKLIKYNRESGELFLKYSFTRNNEEFIYEKTVNAAGKSENERQGIIDNFENEIELPGRGI
ncbi:lipoprotein 17-related variable surface protein [Dyadobacter bucti]|jgi:hypothetical protein|uniref:lipoprotein 17-related variable surface protein n=1 Tax=Dyadobacter bucti TaxID=2572203 RepID=UPI003F7182FA